MNDIVSTMFNRRFIEEIFAKHQPIYSRRVLKTMFDKLAHASIMRLNSNSMDKLYDLMTMAVKYQVLMCHNPKHIISVTLNHLDAILRYVTCSSVRKNVEVAFEYFVQNYSGMSVGELQAIRYISKLRINLVCSHRKVLYPELLSRHPRSGFGFPSRWSSTHRRKVGTHNIRSYHGLIIVQICTTS